jgi:hypothetical protein
MSKPVHILRYGTVGEKAQLEKAINAYDCLAINGNSAAYVSRAIAKFVVEKFFSKKGKGFIIDPITFAFQQNIHLLKNKPKTGEATLKKSIRKLIDIYQEPINKVIDGVPINPSDFKDNSLLKDFCSRVLDFQYSIISTYIDDNDLNKYLKYAIGNMTGLVPQFHPQLLIAPYFYLDPNDPNFEKWLNLNIVFINESIRQAKEQTYGCSIFGQIVINKDVLRNKDIIDSILKQYANCRCNGFTLWVDCFNEHEETQELLNGFIYFLQSLKQHHKDKPIYNMYGSFFSILLTHRSIHLLDGVSHGMEYGEYREVYPVGGGLPVSKYYYMPLHQRKDYTKAFYMLEYNHIIDTSLTNWGQTDRYFNEICKCEQCRIIMGEDMINFVKFESDQYYEFTNKNNKITRRKKASPQTKENCLYHYLLCKKMEFSIMLGTNKVDELLDDLKVEKEKYSNSTFLDDSELDYIDNWCDAINPLVRGYNA